VPSEVLFVPGVTARVSQRWLAGAERVAAGLAENLVRRLIPPLPPGVEGLALGGKRGEGREPKV
jgi:hypothetical protein